MSSSPCKHPVVRVVSRQDDAEFVECQHCGEVFDSVEYADMELEERGALEADGEETGMVQRPGARPASRPKARKPGAWRV